MNGIKKTMNTILNGRYFGDKAHYAVMATGFAMSALSAYWMGRAHQVHQIVNIVEENGSTTFTFIPKNGKEVKVHMNLD